MGMGMGMGIIKRRNSRKKKSGYNTDSVAWIEKECRLLLTF